MEIFPSKHRELNEDIFSFFNETSAKRDHLFVNEQNFAGSALTALEQGITMILSNEEEPFDRLDLFEKLADAGKFISLLHFQICSARRAFISPILPKTEEFAAKN